MNGVKFYVGLHQPADAKHFGLACISINRLRGRKKPVPCGDVLVDSGAFTVPTAILLMSMPPNCFAFSRKAS